MLKRTFLQAYAILPTMEYRARHLSERDLGLYRKNLERELQNERRQQKRLLSKDSMATEDSLTDVTIMISPAIGAIAPHRLVAERPSVKLPTNPDSPVAPSIDTPPF